MSQTIAIRERMSSLVCPLECTFALSRRINRVDLQRNIHVGISLCGRWPHKRGGRINGVAALTGWPH